MKVTLAYTYILIANVLTIQDNNTINRTSSYHCFVDMHFRCSYIHSLRKENVHTWGIMCHWHIFHLSRFINRNHVFTDRCHVSWKNTEIPNHVQNEDRFFIESISISSSKLRIIACSTHQIVDNEVGCTILIRILCVEIIRGTTDENQLGIIRSHPCNNANFLLTSAVIISHRIKPFCREKDLVRNPTPSKQSTNPFLQTFKYVKKNVR